MMNSFSRLHPLAILMYMFKLFKQSIWLIFSGVLFVGSFDFRPYLPEILHYSSLVMIIIFLLLVLSVFVGISWYRWHRFRYRIYEDAIQIVQGILIRRDRTITTKNIHSMNVNQHIFHQVFNLAELKIETAGSDMNVDGELKAIDERFAHQLKRQFTSGLPLNEAGFNELDNDYGVNESEGWKVSIYRLLIAGLTTGRVGAFLTIALILPSELINLLPEGIYKRSESWILHQSIFTWVLGIALYIAVMVAIGMLSYSMRYGRFTIQREGDYLIVKHGLIEKKETQLHMNRIQAVTFKKNLLRMPFGWYGCYVDFAGGEFDEKTAGRLLLFPLVKRREMSAFIQQFLPEYYANERTYRMTDSLGYFYRLARFTLLVLIISTVGFSFYFRWWLVFVIIIIVTVRGAYYYLDYRIKRHTIEGNVLMLHYLLRLSSCYTLIKRTHMLDLNRIESPAMRKLKLCHLKFTVMNNFVGTTFKYGWFCEKQMREITSWYQKC